MLGVSGRAMMAALIAGRRSPAELVALAGPLIDQEQAGRPGAGPHRPVHRPPRGPLEMLLAQLDELSALINQVTARLDPAITALPSPPRPPVYAPSNCGPDTRAAGCGCMWAVGRLCEVPGVGPTPPARSWVRSAWRSPRCSAPPGGCAPGRGSHPAPCSPAPPNGREDRQRQPLPQIRLGQAATGAAKTDTFLGERYRRLIKRMPKAKQNRGRPLHPGHLLPAARRPCRTFQRPRPRPLRQAHGHRAPHRQTRRRTTQPRLVSRAHAARGLTPGSPTAPAAART